jgi:hypothetical protein
MNCTIELIANRSHLMHREDSWEDLEDTAHNVGRGDGHLIVMLPKLLAEVASCRQGYLQSIDAMTA